jgi:hypothetical protein
MSRTVVISQPMLFPWVGLFEQLRLADVLVIYDDVQFSKGGFMNRVQIKTRHGMRWMTVPVQGPFGQRINQVRTGTDDWRGQHQRALAEAYAEAPHRDEMLAMVSDCYASTTDALEPILVDGMQRVLAHFDLQVEMVRSSSMGIGGSGSQRVLDIVAHLGGDTYVTGHGARHYLRHGDFEEQGIQVEYLAYKKRPYPQLHGTFTPYVSVLDLVANRGPQGRDLLCSGTVPWREFLSTQGGQRPQPAPGKQHA